MTPTYEQATDTRLAELHNQWATLEGRLYLDDLKHQAGATFYYKGKRRVTDMTVEQALEILRDEIARRTDDSDYSFAEQARGSNLGQIRTSVARYDEITAKIAAIRSEIREVEALYTGWSRFFLVTSSKGHIHSSLHCSTCRPTTTYGWLPGLSGLTEADAVDAHGPALCTVCFPTAPVEWVGGFITKAQAERSAA